MQAQPELQKFWQQGLHQSFLSFDQTQICYSSFRHPAPRAEIVLSPGRIEAAQKYQEFCFDLYQAGFSVHLIDHRGQGLSDRLNADRYLGDVADFQHYVQDFAIWLEQHISTATTSPAAGHSTLYGQCYFVPLFAATSVSIVLAELCIVPLCLAFKASLCQKQ